MSAVDRPSDPPAPGKPIPPPTASAVEPLPAWELVESGRYRPRRIRGSFPGRELG
jgi:hypothetical protein